MHVGRTIQKWYSGRFLAGVCGLGVVGGTVMCSAAESVGIAAYPRIAAPGFVYTDSEYGVRVNGQPVPVRDYRAFDNTMQHTDRNYYYAHFGIGGETVQVEIDAGEAIESFSISPKAYAIEGTAQGSKLTFALDRPRYLAIRINSKNMLFVLVDAIETDRPASSGVDAATGRPVFNVTDEPYSADRSGEGVVTDALQRAIDAASVAETGGIVYVPEGLYTTHRLTMKDNVWLYLEPGAVLMPDMVRTNWWMGWQPDQMLTIEKTTGNKIYGRGMFYCRNEDFSRQHGPEHKYRLRLRPMKIANVTDFTLDGITAIESGEWTFTVEGGERIALRNVKVLNEKKLGTNDGIDICGGTDVLVERCFVTTMDDAYCVKGMRGDLRNVRFHDNVADTTKSAFKIGMQGMNEVDGLAVTEFHAIRCYKGIDLCHYYGSAAWHNIRFADGRFEQVIGGPGNPVMGGSTPIRLVIARQTTFGYPKGVGPIYDVDFSRIKFDDPGPNAIALRGYDATNNVRNITFTDVTLGDRLLKVDSPDIKILEHVQNVTIQGESVLVPAACGDAL